MYLFYSFVNHKAKNYHFIINPISPLDNCSKFKSDGATYAGYHCGWNKSKIGDHPDGHPHLPGESHHDCPHLHVYGSNGESLAIIKYKRN